MWVRSGAAPPQSTREPTDLPVAGGSPGGSTRPARHPTAALHQRVMREELPVSSVWPEVGAERDP